VLRTAPWALRHAAVLRIALTLLRAQLAASRLEVGWTPSDAPDPHCTALKYHLTPHYPSGDQAVVLMWLLVLRPLAMQVAYAWRGSLLRAELMNKSQSERAATAPEATTPQRTVRRNPNTQARA
jgi:hypothetical protein